MEALQLVEELKIYEAKLEAIKSRFVRTREGIWIAKGDEPLLRQYVRELSDFFNDALGPNNYSRQILDDFNQGIANYVHSPSLHSVQNILATVRAVRTRIDRNPQLHRPKRCRESSFLVYAVFTPDDEVTARGEIGTACLAGVPLPWLPVTRTPSRPTAALRHPT